MPSRIGASCAKNRSIHTYIYIYSVEGLGLRIQDLWFRVQGLVFRILGVGFTIQDLGFLDLGIYHSNIEQSNGKQT